MLLCSWMVAISFDAYVVYRDTYLIKHENQTHNAYALMKFNGHFQN
jgi:hypothetical protein